MMRAEDQAYAAMFEGRGARQLGRGALALGLTGGVICALSALMAILPFDWLVPLFVFMSMTPYLWLRIAHGHDASLDQLSTPQLIGALIAITVATLVGLIGYEWIEAAAGFEGQSLPVSAQFAEVYARTSLLWCLFSLAPAAMLLTLYVKSRLH